MKKLVFAALAASTMFATPAFAQNQAGVTDTDDTLITANIPEVCELTAPADVTITDFLTNGSGGTVGTLRILCNDPDGFVLTTTTDNGGSATAEGSPAGLLLPTDSSADSSIIYRVAIGGNTLFGQPKTAQNLSAGGPADFVAGKDLTVNWISSGIRDGQGNAGGQPYAGIYQDTVTFTVTSN